MKRRNFLFTMLALYPASLFSKINFIFEKTGKGFIVRRGESRTGEHILMKGVTVNNLDVKISSSDTNGDVVVFEQTGHTLHGGPPLHIHPDQDEWFFVVEGEYFFQIGDDKYRIGEGDTIFLPRKIQHAFCQLTEKARVIVSYQPAGKMEDFFKASSTMHSPATKEEVAKLFQDHGMLVAGKPLDFHDAPDN